MPKLMEATKTVTWTAQEPVRAKVTSVEMAKPETRRERIRRLALEITKRDAEALAILAK